MKPTQLTQLLKKDALSVYQLIKAKKVYKLQETLDSLRRQYKVADDVERIEIIKQAEGIKAELNEYTSKEV